MKFLRYCSCIECKIETTTQSLKSHLATHNPLPKCIMCLNSVSKNSNKYCSRSCSAKDTNSKKDFSIIKTGPPKGSKPTNYYPRTKIKLCEECEMWHSRNARTCSIICYKKFMSKIQKNNAKTINFNANRGRGKQSYLEKSFSGWLSSNYPNIIVKPEEPFKRKDNSTVFYNVDFYFPDKKLIIELDGSQHVATKEYDADRDAHILKNYGDDVVEIIRISHKEYKDKSKLDLVKSKLSN